MSLLSIKTRLLNHTDKNQVAHTIYLFFIKRLLFICILLSQHAACKYEVVSHIENNIDIQTYTYKNDENNSHDSRDKTSSKITDGIQSWLECNALFNNGDKNNSFFRIIIPTKYLDSTPLDENPSPYLINTETLDDDISDYQYWPCLHQIFFPKQVSYTNKKEANKTLASRFAILVSMATIMPPSGLTSKSKNNKITDIIPPTYQMNQKYGYLPICPSLAHLKSLESIKKLKDIIPEVMDNNKAGLKFQLWLTKTDLSVSSSKFCKLHFNWTLFPYMDPTKKIYEEIPNKKCLKIKCRRVFSDIHFLCIVTTSSDAEEIKNIVTAEAQSSHPITDLSKRIIEDVNDEKARKIAIKRNFIEETDKATEGGNLMKLTFSILVIEPNDITGHVASEESQKNNESEESQKNQESEESVEPQEHVKPKKNR